MSQIRLYTFHQFFFESERKKRTSLEFNKKTSEHEFYWLVTKLVRLF